MTHVIVFILTLLTVSPAGELRTHQQTTYSTAEECMAAGNDFLAASSGSAAVGDAEVSCQRYDLNPLERPHS